MKTIKEKGAKIDSIRAKKDKSNMNKIRYIITDHEILNSYFGGFPFCHCRGPLPSSCNSRRTPLKTFADA